MSPTSSSGAIAIRHGTPGDLDTVLSLWRAAAQPTTTDNAEALGLLVAEDPEALLVAQADDVVVGTLIAAWNGWRGSFNRLVVDPAHRRKGIAAALVREGERSLRGRGAARLYAVVEGDSAVAMEFWAAIGYEHQQGQTRFVRTFPNGP
jgi:ribosomal protein S18 acetylase RimI-like enzyme